MDWIIWAELAATGREETSSFHTLSVGKMGQFGAPGSTPGRRPPTVGVAVGVAVG
jgi:hypothetical protein